MQIEIDLKRAEGRHQEAVADIVNQITQKLQKAKKEPCTKEDLTWSYVWAQRLGGDPLDNCFVNLQGRLERRWAVTGLAPEGNPTPREDLPEEIIKAYEVKPGVCKATYPHVAEFTLVSPDKTPRVALALSGYRSKSGIYLHVVEEGDRLDHNGRAFEILYKITQGYALWNGSLHNKAKQAFDSTQAGDDFRYRNMKFTRLTNDEIRSLVQDKNLIFSMGHET